MVLSALDRNPSGVEKFTYRHPGLSLPDTGNPNSCQLPCFYSVTRKREVRKVDDFGWSSTDLDRPGLHWRSRACSKLSHPLRESSRGWQTDTPLCQRHIFCFSLLGRSPSYSEKMRPQLGAAAVNQAYTLLLSGRSVSNIAL